MEQRDLQEAFLQVVLGYCNGEEKDLNTFQKILRHPAGRIGLTLGVTLGFIAAVMGEGSKALLFAGLCRFLAGKFGR
jgi:hypothetical protein